MTYLTGVQMRMAQRRLRRMYRRSSHPGGMQAAFREIIGTHRMMGHEKALVRRCTVRRVALCRRAWETLRAIFRSGTLDRHCFQTSLIRARPDWVSCKNRQIRDCGKYRSRRQHLDQNGLVIYSFAPARR